MANRDLQITRLNRTLPVRLLVACAGLIGRLLPLRNRSGLFFFFPFCHVGGAEKVHADIVSCFARERPWVFFTKRSENEKFRPFFNAGRNFNLWWFFKYGYPFSVGIMAGLINHHPNAVVFGSNSLFYYLLLPYLRSDIRKVDLLHAFGGASDEFSFTAVDFIDQRIVITAKTLDDMRAQYKAGCIDIRLLERITLIENMVNVPPIYNEKAARNIVNVLFIGRGAPEKRIHIIGKAASLCRKNMIQAQFILAGNVIESVEAADRENCLFLGEISDTSKLNNIYSNADILVLTSSREGFPLVIMEAMAHGVVPVCTAVGGIPLHIQDATNGLLLKADDEEGIVDQLVLAITQLSNDKEKLHKLSKAAYEYANHNFSGNFFCQSYRKVINDHR